jgi:hypothetical protein
MFSKSAFTTSRMNQKNGKESIKRLLSSLRSHELDATSLKTRSNIWKISVFITRKKSTSTKQNLSSTKRNGTTGRISTITFTPSTSILRRKSTRSKNDAITTQRKLMNGKQNTYTSTNSSTILNTNTMS